MPPEMSKIKSQRDVAPLRDGPNFSVFRDDGAGAA
jgi:hypothetical protein